MVRWYDTNWDVSIVKHSNIFIHVSIGGTLTIVDMESDGNCLFRSISDQLYYDYGNNHHEIRDDICNYIEDHKDDFIFFLVLDDKDAAENDEDATDFESYVTNMRHDGDWGGQIELLAASRVYRYVQMYPLCKG